MKVPFLFNSLNKILIKIFVTLFYFSGLSFYLSAQIVHPDAFSSENNNNTILYKGSGNYILRERSDFRRYDNGKYVGLVNQEVSSFIIPVSFDDYYYYEGNFYIFQETRRNLYSINMGLEDSIPSKFKIDKNGNLQMVEDHGFPSFRSFPTFSNKKLIIGDTWNGKAERAVDPLNKGVITKLPIQVQYKYIRDDYFKDEPVYVISAQWATRYGMGTGNYYIDWGGDKELQKATGSHKATIFVSKSTGNSLLIQDIVDETFVYSDGNQYQFKGTISLFTEYPPAIDRSKIIPTLRRIADISDEQAKQLTKVFTENTTENGTNNSIYKETSKEKSKENSEENPDTDNSIRVAQKDNDEYSEKNNYKDSDTIASSKNTITHIVSENNSKINDSQNDNQNSKHIESTNKLSSDSIIDSKNPLNNIENKNSHIANSSTEKEKPLVTVDNTPAGIRLTLPDLQFKPDSAELLDGETDRLNKIAEVLKEIPDCNFLIEGHTAAVGNEKGEMQLSIERANTIANAFIKRGISKDRLICKGSGGTKPIAENTTSEGKSKNRRVEITILE